MDIRSTLPQRMGLKLLASYPDIVDGRVIDVDFRAVGQTALPGVVPNSVVEVRNQFGLLNPLIVIDDQGPRRPVASMAQARQTDFAVWIFYPASSSANRRVLELREMVDLALDGTLDLLPATSPYFPGEGTRGDVRFVQGIGTITDGEAMYDRMLYRVSHTKTVAG